MFCEPTLSVKNLGKSFVTYRSEWQRFARWFGLPASPQEEHRVLRNISFDIHPGEATGILGRNGAGKSTLLKMITGTLQPTEGHVHIRGKIAAILELGMGFNPELTGRQNVVYTAGLMGFSLEQINSMMPNIQAFAEIGEHFDDTLRTYSSGMQMRVAFAVATAQRPEILIVDEALSVGDAYFQHKSFSRIKEFQKQGTTLLIVSHDKTAIQSLCNRAILLDGGRIIKDGKPEMVFDFYNALIAEKENSQVVEVNHLSNGKVQICSGSKEAVVESIGLFNAKGEHIEVANVGEKVCLHITVKVFAYLDTLVLGYGIKDRLGQVMYGTNTWHTKQVIKNTKPGDIYRFAICFNANFGLGSYSVQTALVDKDTHLTANYEWRDMALLFNVVNIDKTTFAGCCWNEPIIEIEGLKT